MMPSRGSRNHVDDWLLPSVRLSAKGPMESLLYALRRIRGATPAGELLLLVRRSSEADGCPVLPQRLAIHAFRRCDRTRLSVFRTQGRVRRASAPAQPAACRNRLLVW